MSSRDDPTITSDARLARVLLSLTRDLLERSISPAFYDTILEHALELVPGAQAGSLIVRGDDGNYRFAATRGFDLDRLVSVVFSEEHILADFGDADHAFLIRNVADRNESLLPVPLSDQLRDLGDTARIRSTLAFPIVLDGQIAATFRLDNFEDADAFGDESLRLAEALGHHLGTVVRRLRLQDRAEQAVRAQTLRADIERLLLASDDITEFFPALTRRLAQDLAVDGCLIFHLRPGEERIEALDARGQRLPRLERLLEGAGHLQRAGDARLIERLRRDGWMSIPDTADVEFDRDVRAIVGSVEVAPLHLGDTTWGVLNIFSKTPNAFSPRDRGLLSSLTEGIELELQHQAQRERMREQVERLRRLVVTTDEISVAEHEADVARLVLDAVLDAVRADTATLLWLEPSGDALRVVDSRRRSGSGAATVGASVARGDTLSWRVLEAGALEWSRGDEGGGSVAAAALGLGPAEVLLGVPLRSRAGQPSGALVAAICEPGRDFDPERVSFFEAVAQAAGAALVRVELLDESREQARTNQELYESASARAEELALLDELRRAVARALGVDDVIRAAVEGTARLVGKTMVSAFMVEGDELVLHHGVGYADLPKRMRLDQGIMGRVARTGRAELVLDTASDPDFFSSGDGVQSEVAVPLLVDGEVLGVLNAEAVGPDFDEDDVRLLGAVAEQVSVAVQHARLNAAIRDSERRFRLLAEHMRDLVCLHSPDGPFTYVSPSSASLLGYESEELIGRTLFDLATPADHPLLEESFRALRFGDDHAEPVTYRALAKGGRAMWLETTSQVVRDDDGAVVGIVTSSRDATLRKEYEERLRRDAMYDELTDLPNRALLMDRLDQVLVRESRDPTKRFAVLFIDLDRFKAVNDSLGHGAGDALLAAVAARLTAAVRKVDTVARLGGDEFCILLDDLLDDDDAIVAAERVHATLRAAFDIEGRALFMTASIGIAYSSGDHRDADEILRDADIAMYRAKYEGRPHAVFDVAMHARAVSRLELETDLREALDRGDLSVAYQPILALHGERLIGFEALVRWYHPHRGAISPGEFIPLAEESGLIAAIDRFVMRAACAQIALWRRVVPDVSVSVNVSAVHVSLDDLVATVEGALAAAGLPSEALRLEITESALMAGADAAVEALGKLRSRGIQVQIDDFGTGYSSLGYLRRLPIDTLKIDRSFIEGVADDEGSREIVTAIVHLARNLGIDVVAEGIETRQQLEFLRALGCEAGQGYLFAPPLSAADVELEGWTAPAAR
ncbi:MAG: EAL domain-containing protein [Trueperaceae bacterium]|nr:EAL domain-containing protein [Trueperaceae bacterium]